MKDQYGTIFEDPSRLPTFDQKTRLWEVSSKFKIEDNDDPDDFNEDFRHPFLEKMLWYGPANVGVGNLIK